jgi:hypothetical protein
VTGHWLDLLNQPDVFFLLLVGSGGFLIVGELQSIMRRTRRSAGKSDATGTSTSVRPCGLGRQYRLGLLATAGLLLLSAFGTTSASFTSQLSGGMQVEVVLPTDTPTPTPTAIDTPTPEPTPTDTPALPPTLASTPAPTDTPTPSPTPAPQAS